MAPTTLRSVMMEVSSSPSRGAVHSSFAVLTGGEAARCRFIGQDEMPQSRGSNPSNPSVLRLLVRFFSWVHWMRRPVGIDFCLAKIDL